jgi:hypothetical protein
MHGYPHHAYGRGIQYAERAEGPGDKLFADACNLGLEGIVSKKLDAPYRSGSVCLTRSSRPLSLEIFEGGLDPVAPDQNAQIIQ